MTSSSSFYLLLVLLEEKDYVKFTKELNRVSSRTYFLDLKDLLIYTMSTLQFEQYSYLLSFFGKYTKETITFMKINRPYDWQEFIDSLAERQKEA